MSRIFIVCVALMYFSAYAHNYHHGISAIEYNERTRALELVHTLVAHDLEAALIRRHDKTIDLGQSGIESIIQHYVDEHVQLQTKDSGKQAIAWVGYEIDAQQVRIFQEVKDFLPRQFSLSNTLLFDLHSNQKNTVNVTMGKIRMSKILSATDNTIDAQ